MFYKFVAISIIQQQIKNNNAHLSRLQIINYNYHINKWINKLGKQYPTQMLLSKINKYSSHFIIRIPSIHSFTLCNKFSTMQIQTIITQIMSIQQANPKTQLIGPLDPTSIRSPNPSKLIPNPIPYNKITPSLQRYKNLKNHFIWAANLQQIYNKILINWQQIQQVGKTIVLDFLHDYPLPKNNDCSQQSLKIILQINKLTNLNLYQLTKKLSILQKYQNTANNNQNYQKQYNTFILECQQQIIRNINQLIKQDNLSIYDYINLVDVVQLNKDQGMLENGLKILDFKILKMQQYQSFQFQRLYKLIFPQLAQCNWQQLKQFPNIIKYITSHFTIKITDAKQYIQQLSNIFIIACKFRFHLVGERTIPKCLKQIVILLKPYIDLISQKNLCLMIDACTLLPDNLYPEFKKYLVKRLLETPKGKCLGYFPFNALTIQEINDYFNIPEAKALIWQNIIQINTQKYKQKIFQTSIVNLLKQSLTQKYQKLQDVTLRNSIVQSQKPTQYYSLAHYFLLTKDNKYLQKLKFIISLYFQTHGILQSMHDIVLSQYIDLFQLFHQDEPMMDKLKTNFFKILNQSRNKINIYGQNYTQSCLQAIHIHIYNQQQIIQKAVNVLVNQLLYQQKTIKIKQKQIKILLQIMKHNQTQQLANIKNKLWQKVTPQDLQTICQYLIFNKKLQTQKILQQILALLRLRKITFQKLLLFFTALDMETITKMQGRFLSIFVSYLQQLRQNLNVNPKYINQLNKFLNIVLSLQSNQNKSYGFLKRLFIENLNVIENQDIVHGQNRIHIINFIFKFQQILSIQKIIQPINFMVFKKILMIFKKILVNNNTTATTNNTTTNNNTNTTNTNIQPYIQIKYIQFTKIYKQYLPPMQPIQKKRLQNLQKLLKSQKNIQQYQQILFILLKLVCISSIQLNTSDTQFYIATICQSIRKNQLNIEKISQGLQSLIYQIKISKPKQKIVRRCRKIISVILDKYTQKQINNITNNNNNNIKNNTINYNFILLKPFLKYYILTSQIFTKQNILISILNNNNINSIVIIFYIKNIPFIMYKDTTTGKLLDILLNKIVNTLPYLYNNLIEILYLVERIFYTCPQRYKDVYEKIWYFTGKYLQRRINFIKVKNMEHKYIQKQTDKNNTQQKDDQNTQQKDRQKSLNLQKLLGKYPLYMFCCIKNNKTHTKIFKFLSKYIYKNRKQFIKIAQRQGNKYIFQCIQTFICLQHKQINNIPKINIDNTNTNNNTNTNTNQKQNLKIIPKIQSSQSLKLYFKNNNMEYQYCIEINGVIVPYYVSQENMIVIVANRYSLQNNLKQNQMELENGQLDVVQKQMQNEGQKGNEDNSLSVDLTCNKLDNEQKQNTCDKFNGHLKFQFEMLIRLFPNKKIRIWDDFQGKFILQ